MFAHLDHPLHLVQVGFILLLLLAVTSGLLLVETVNVSRPASLDVGDADVSERRVVGRHESPRNVQAVLNAQLDGRRDLVLLLVQRLVVGHRDDELIKILELWQVPLVASHISINSENRQ